MKRVISLFMGIILSLGMIGVVHAEETRSVTITTGQYVSVVDFGANGYDQEDDTEAIQAAIDSLSRSGREGGTVYFPNGVYYISSPITINNAVSFCGASKDTTVLRAKESIRTLFITAGYDTFMNMSYAKWNETMNVPQNFSVTNLTLDGYGKSQNGILLYGYNYNLENLNIIECNDAGIIEHWGSGNSDICNDGESKYTESLIKNIYINGSQTGISLNELPNTLIESTEVEHCTVGIECNTNTYLQNVTVKTCDLGIQINEQSYLDTVDIRESENGIELNGKKTTLNHCNFYGNSNTDIKVGNNGQYVLMEDTIIEYNAKNSQAILLNGSNVTINDLKIKGNNWYTYSHPVISVCNSNILINKALLFDNTCTEKEIYIASGLSNVVIHADSTNGSDNLFSQTDNYQVDNNIPSKYQVEVPVYKSVTFEVCGNCGLEASYEDWDAILALMDHLLECQGGASSYNVVRQVQVGTTLALDPNAWNKNLNPVNQSINQIFTNTTTSNIDNSDTFVNVKDFGATGSLSGGVIAVCTWCGEEFFGANQNEAVDLWFDHSMETGCQGYTARKVNTDATEAIQAAIDSLRDTGGTVYLPAGTYQITSELVLYSNITLLGDGERATTIYLGNNVDSRLLVTENGCHNFAIKNIGFYGNQANSFSSVGLEINGSNFNLENIWIDSVAGDGIHVTSSDTSECSTVKNMNIKYCWGNGAVYAGSSKVYTDSITVSECYGTGLDVSNQSLFDFIHLYSNYGTYQYIDNAGAIVHTLIVESAAGSAILFNGNDAIVGNVQSSSNNDIDIIVDDNSNNTQISVVNCENPADSNTVISNNNNINVQIISVDGVPIINEREQPEKYTVTFQTNINNYTIPSQHVDENALATEPNITEQPNMTFLGWYLQANFSGEPFDFANTPITQNITLYAKWEEKILQAEIVFDQQGGHDGTESIEVTNNELPNIDVPIRDGYTFEGYYTEPNGRGDYYYDSTGTPLQQWNGTEQATLYAKWTANIYVVKLNGLKGNGGSSMVVATYDQSMPPIVMPTRTGYTFGGYFEEQLGRGNKYYDGKGKSVRNWDKTETTTLFAYWMANTYKLTFDFNGGTDGTSSVTAYYDSAVPSVAIPHRNGYYFEGYYLTENNKEVKYYDDRGRAVRNWDIADTRTLTAKWELENYTVTFNQQDGVGDIEPLSIIYDEELPEIETPTKDGYDFDGYYTKEGGKGTQYYDANGVPTQTWMQVTDTTLYANWIPKQYSVALISQNIDETVSLDDLSEGEDYTWVTVTYHKNMPLITVPKLEDYAFKGYYSDVNGYGEQYYNARGASTKRWDETENAVLYALWTPIDLSDNVVYGDTNGDGSIDSDDAMLIIQYYAGFVDESEIDVAASDVNHDGNVDSDDAMLVLQYYGGFIDSLD